jgi:TRAP transporter TAXI family solute receptor
MVAGMVKSLFNKFAVGVRAGACALAILLAAAGATAAQSRTPEFFRIGTGGVDGTYFPIGSLIAEGITAVGKDADCTPSEGCSVAGVIAVPQVSNGSVANVEGVAAGELEAGLAQADVVEWAFHGTEIFANKGKLSGLRAVANLYPESVHVVARADAGISGISDLRGKRVALDEPGSGTLVDARIILRAHSIVDHDIEPEYIKPDLARAKLKENELDAMFIVAGYPTRSIAELAEDIDIRLLEIGETARRAITRRYGFLTAGVIPAGTYRGVPKTPTLQVGAQLVVSEASDETLIYEITKALWSARTRRLLDNGHPRGKSIRLSDSLNGITIPLHPGAARFYREAGILK